MFGTRLFHLLLLALALACVSSALAPEVNNNALEARQDDDSDDDGATISIDLPTDAATSTEAIETSVTESAPVEEETSTEVVESTTPVETSTTEAEPTTSTEEIVEETSSTEAIPESTTSTTISQPTSEADPSTTESEDSVSSTTTEAATTSTEDSGDSEEEEETSTTKAEPVTSTSFQTITRTNSAGELETTTSASVTTSDPELSEDDGGDSGGLPTNTRNIIIGVVVGVGGAIILGALGIVAWRIRARKKLAEENDGLMEYNGGYTPVDKSEGPAPGSSPSTAPTGSTRTPFQSTLENYHQPSQPVNASSNF